MMFNFIYDNKWLRYIKKIHPILQHYFIDFMIVEKLRLVEKLVKKNCDQS